MCVGWPNIIGNGVWDGPRHATLMHREIMRIYTSVHTPIGMHTHMQYRVATFVCSCHVAILVLLYYGINLFAELNEKCAEFKKTINNITKEIEVCLY